MPNPTDTTRSQEATEAKTRPTWLTDGCPPWCEAGDEHSERDHYEDRRHFGPSGEVVLTATRDRGIARDDMPSVARMHLSQHYREIGPRIILARDDNPVDIELTLGEAEEFACKLLELVGIADRPAAK